MSVNMKMCLNIKIPLNVKMYLNIQSRRNGFKIGGQQSLEKKCCEKKLC